MMFIKDCSQFCHITISRMEVAVGVVIASAIIYVVYNCRSHTIINHVSASNNTAGGTMIIGDQLISNYTHVPAAKLKLVAYDKHDKVLQTTVLPKGTQVVVKIQSAAHIDYVRVAQGKVEITVCGGIGKVRTSKGTVHIGKAEDIKEIRTSQGSIQIDSCDTVGSTKTSQGTINVHERSPARPQ